MALPLKSFQCGSIGIWPQLGLGSKPLGVLAPLACFSIVPHPPLWTLFLSSPFLPSHLKKGLKDKQYYWTHSSKIDRNSHRSLSPPDPALCVVPWDDKRGFWPGKPSLLPQMALSNITRQVRPCRGLQGAGNGVPGALHASNSVLTCAFLTSSALRTLFLWPGHLLPNSRTSFIVRISCRENSAGWLTWEDKMVLLQFLIEECVWKDT